MKEPPGGYAAVEADPANRFTLGRVAGRNARSAAWTFIALGVICFCDGSVIRGESGRVLALDVVLPDRRVVSAGGTSVGRRDAPLEKLAAIRQAAERHAILAELTGTAANRGSLASPANPGCYADPGGQPGLRGWDNSTTWSPFFLRTDPASAKADSRKALAEVWSSLAGEDPQWRYAARQARAARG